MADVFSKEKRSEVMRLIRGKNTKAEIITFRYLRKEGIYFQKHYKRALGCPDIALPRKKLAVFIDGDFWHGKTFDRVKERGPDDFWTKKIQRNMERDKEQMAALEANGWKVLRIWEMDILRKRTNEDTLCRIAKFLTT